LIYSNLLSTRKGRRTIVATPESVLLALPRTRHRR
jgi:hypothetical protein